SRSSIARRTRVEPPAGPGWGCSSPAVSSLPWGAGSGSIRPKAAGRPSRSSSHLRRPLLRRTESSPDGKEGRDVARVLVIDDEAPIRLLCRVNLEAAGREALEAENG